MVKRVLRDLETLERGEILPPVETMISISVSTVGCNWLRGRCRNDDQVSVRKMGSEQIGLL